MSTPDDYLQDMGMHSALDDTTAEALLAGRPVLDEELMPVAALLSNLRVVASETPPAPSLTLAAVLAGEPVGATAPAFRPVLGKRPGTLRPSPLSRLLRNVAAAGFAAKIAMGAGVAAASITGAAAAGVLPDSVQDAIADAVRAVTPFEFPSQASDRTDPHGGGILDAPGGPATGRTVPADDGPIPTGDTATSSPDRPPGGAAGDAPSTPIGPIGGSPPGSAPGATPTTSAPRPDADGDAPAGPPAVQPDRAPTTPQPAPTTPEPAPTTPEAAPTTPAPTPAPEPVEPPTTAPIPLEPQSPEIPYEAPTSPSAPAETGRR